MSRPGNVTYRGRFNQPVPTSNLMDFEEDFPEFQPFEDVAESEARPRGPAPGAGTFSVMQVNIIDMRQQVNRSKHYTSAYDTQNLLIRRGQEFTIQVTFNRPPTPQDYFQLEFLIGSDPSPNKGSLVVVTFTAAPVSQWLGQIVSIKGQSVLLSITPSASAIVGKYRTYVAIYMANGMQRTKRDTSTDLYLLFNAWCRDDLVFLPDESQRREYVLNDIGVIYRGSVGAVTQLNWMYGQFERGVLDACIYILDSSQMPIQDRGDIVKLVRKASAVLNSQDDNGVLVGNWSDDFSMGTPPSSWTGSVMILLQYANTGVPVCFAQCWVYAGVFSTFLRCLGVPVRVVTTFNSAHDNTGNLKTDLIFRPDGTPDTRNTRDSIWNYHCWNEVFMKRPDLPPGLEGWQAVDATPQETSDGNYRCGPASVIAIKEGLLCHPFDSGFVFAEVNSDVVCLKRDRYGNLSPFYVDKTLVGQAVYTKSVGSSAPMDITQSYKYPEGSEEDSRTMARAEEYGCERDHSELAEAKMSVDISTAPCYLGQDVHLVVTFHNQSEAAIVVNAHLDVSVVFYTGVTANSFKAEPFTVTVPANQKTSIKLKVLAQEYMPHLGSQLYLHFSVTGQSDNQSLSAIKVMELQTPSLTMTVSGRAKLQQEMVATVTFTNPFDFDLQNVHLCMEGAGLMSARHRDFNVIKPQGSISWQEVFTPRLAGQRRLLAVLDSNTLHQVCGHVDVTITP
ncbi:coagulation factor XIII A chain-like [Parambassis ranga]|uniref:protein-glutamine gamma-glutamyltransferase n=1 Tax=Parambassis ranga TaxID=210632 RepID=A0A6P7KES2_9TELE|nr:coagulation factor XIII A chain-like [Parambassis ranga]